MKIKDITLFMIVCVFYIILSIMILYKAVMDGECIFPCLIVPLIVMFLMLCGMFYISEKCIRLMKCIWIGRRD